MWNDLEVIARLLVFLLCSDYFIWFVVILSKLRVIEQDLKAFRGFLQAILAVLMFYFICLLQLFEQLDLLYCSYVIIANLEMLLMM